MRRTLRWVTGERSVLLGLVLYLLIAVAPTVLFWACLRVIPRLAGALIDRRHARRAAPRGPTLERTVADVRRLRGELRRPGHRSRVRRVATRQAYDEALVTLCEVLGLSVPPLDGPDRAFARLLAEASVEQAGVALDPPGGTGHAAA
jgi:hypothetical protein